MLNRKFITNKSGWNYFQLERFLFKEQLDGFLRFYKKNKFLVNDELYNKNRKTISMRKDIYL